MSKNMDRRVRKTRAQLRQGLAELLKEKSLKEITVKELVEKVDINRSTFYLHYADIYDMMEKIENELTGDIEDLIRSTRTAFRSSRIFFPSSRKTGISAPLSWVPTVISLFCTGLRISSPSTA